MKKLIKTIILLLFFLAVFAGPIYAGELAIILNDLPDYETTTDFKVFYTAIETDQKAVKVNLFIQKDGKDWRQTTEKDKTGYSGEFKMAGADLYDNEGKYNFKAVVESEGRTLESGVVSTTLDMTPPSPPSEYGKERINPTTYKLTWKNPSADDFAKVYIYRSKDKSFTADSGTRIGEAGGSKEEKITFNDGSLPEANVDFYYALRALDHAGNASNVVTDAPGVVEEGQVAGAAITPATQRGEVVSLPKEEETDTSESETPEGELGGGISEEEKVKGVTTPKFSKTVLGLIALAVILLIIFLRRRKDSD